MVAGVAFTVAEAAPSPAAFVATMRKEYAVPFTRPPEVYDSEGVVSMRTHAPPFTGARSIAYEMIAEPPLSIGAVHERAT